MAIDIKQFNGKTVTPDDDAQLYNYIVRQSGIVAGCVVSHMGANQLHITSGWGVVQGRRFVVSEETILATVATSGTLKGRLAICVDTSNTSTPIKFITQAAETLPPLVQQDINSGGGTYEMELATYDVSNVLISNLAITNNDISNGPAIGILTLSIYGDKNVAVTLTCGEKELTTNTGEAGAATVNLPNPGTWHIVGKLSGVEIYNAYKDMPYYGIYTISDLYDAPEYGVRFATGQQSSVGERVSIVGGTMKTGAATGLVAGVGIGGTPTTNSFDSIAPWCDFEDVYEGADYRMTKIPRFYIKEYTADGYDYTMVCMRQKAGYRVAEPFKRPNGTIADYYEIARYEVSSGYKSKTGCAPLVNITRPALCTGAAAIGSGWHITTADEIHDIMEVLFMIEFATKNSQSIMRGIVDTNAAVATGKTDSVAATSGVPGGTPNSTSQACIWRGIENPWGNVWKHVGGLNISNYKAYYCKDPALWADGQTTGAYVPIGYTNATTTDSYIKKLGYDAAHPAVRLPTVVGGSDSTYYADKYWCASGNKTVFFGGSWNSAAAAGLFCWSLNDALGASNAVIGGRLSRTL